MQQRSNLPPQEGGFSGSVPPPAGIFLPHSIIDTLPAFLYSRCSVVFIIDKPSRFTGELIDSG